MAQPPLSIACSPYGVKTNLPAYRPIAKSGGVEGASPASGSDGYLHNEQMAGQERETLYIARSIDSRLRLWYNIEQEFLLTVLCAIRISSTHHT